MKKDDLKIKKDIQLKCPGLTDDVLKLLTEYLIVQISDNLKEDARIIGLSSVVSDGQNYSSMYQTENGVNFVIS